MSSILFDPSTPLETRIALIRKWGPWFIDRLGGLADPAGTELAFLLHAIARDIFIWLGRDSRLVMLLRENEVPRGDAVWRYIRLRWEHDN
jgi:hypothetical protein